MDCSKRSQHQLAAGWRGWDGAVTHLPSSRERYPQPDIRTTNTLKSANTLVLSALSWNRKVSNPVLLITKNHGTPPVGDSVQKRQTLSSFPMLFFFFFEFVRRQLIPIFGTSHIPTTHSWLYPHTFICSSLSPLHEISQTTRTHRISICTTSHGLPTDLFRLGGESGAGHHGVDVELGWLCDLPRARKVTGKTWDWISQKQSVITDGQRHRRQHRGKER